MADQSIWAKPWGTLQRWRRLAARWRTFYPALKVNLWQMRMVRQVRKAQRQGNIPVLFYLSIWGHCPFILPIVQELRKQAPGIDLYLAIDEPGGHPDGDRLGISRDRWRSLRDYLPIRGFQMFVTPNNNMEYWPQWPRKVCIFHSQPAKGVNFQDRYLRRFDVLFLLGPLVRSAYEAFARQYPETAAQLRTFDVGYPKLDALARGDYSRQTILAGLGLDPAKPTVLFAPSFGRGTSLRVFGESLLQALNDLAATGINVVVKLHPVMHNPQCFAFHCGGKNWPEILDACASATCMRGAGNVDLSPLLAASDVMVTDVSSAALDFMLLDRPVVYIDCPEFLAMVDQPGTHYSHYLEAPARDLRVADVGRSAGLVVSGLEEMASAIRRSLDHPGEFSAARRKIAEQLLFNPGHAAEVAARTLLELVGGQETGDGGRRQATTEGAEGGRRTRSVVSRL